MTYYKSWNQKIKSHADSTTLDDDNSLIHLMCAIACAHASTLATSLMHVKNNMRHFCL